MKRKHILILFTFILGLPWIAAAQTFGGGSGTSADPYKISSATDWNSLATAVNGGTAYSGKYFKLTASISISKVVGNSSRVFSGTFDGQGYTLTVALSGTPASGNTPAVNNMAGLAPFGCISGATLKNLIVTGTVSQANGSCPHASGLVGYTFGGTTNTLENCVVHTNVTNTANSGNCHVGGIIGHASSATVNMRGCVYDGKITCTSAGSAIGGLLGWSSASNLTLNHCIFDGTIDRGEGPDYCIFHPIGCRDGNVPTGTVTNCYYTLAGTIADDHGRCVVSNTTGKGKFAYSITGNKVAVANRGTATNYNVSTITGYSVGIKYKGKLYAGNTDAVSLSFNTPGYTSVSGYSASSGSLSGSAHTGNNDSYTLTMAAANSVINATVTGQKFHIARTSSSTQMTWAEFAAAVSAGTTYSGQTVYLDEDISGVTQPAGTVTINSSGNYATGQSFFGTFDGGGHTITVNLASDTEGGNAPFRSIDGATIKDLVVEGTVNANSGGNALVPNGNRHPSGLVGFVNTSCTIQNCLVKANIGSGTDYIGGIIGHVRTSHATIIGCVYAGTITAARSTGETGQVGGLIGWSDAASDVATVTQITVTNCFFVGNVNWIDDSDHDDYDKEHFNPIACCNTSSTGSATHTYYTKDANDSPTTVFSNSGKHAYSITGAAHVVVARRDNPTTTYNVSKLDIYNPALVYDGTLYAGNTEVVPLSLGCPGYSFTRYTADHGTLSGSAITGTNDPYTLTMQAYNTVISVTSPVQKFHIANASNTTQMTLSEFAAAVNAGTTYSGQTVYVDEDIANTTVTVGAGTPSTPFQGTFEGQGHVVNFTCSANIADKGLLGYVSGAGTVKNVIVNATLSGSSTSVGAVVGTFASTGTISNVEGAGTISSTATDMGGIVGRMTSGTLHSSFAVATLSGSATNKGGLVGTNGGNLYNSYSNCTYSGTSTNKGGLVGVNNSGKNVKNCYAAGIASGVSALAGSNSGTIECCYANAVGNGYVGSSSTAPSGCGLYGAVKTSIKDLDYMYRDNLITKNTNTYVGSNDAVADGISVYYSNHIPVWNGLVSALNQWVRANPESISGLSPWYRPLTTSVNGDLPVLGFANNNSLGTLNNDGKFLRYGSTQNSANGIDALLATYNGGTAASIFHYGAATGVTRVPSGNVHVYVHEDAVLLQATSPDPGAFVNTTVGVTFDNSDHGQHAYDYWGTRLDYDWHFLSTPLNRPLTGAVHSVYTPSGNANSPVDITSVGGYFPDGLITGGNPAVGGAIKWDFYNYYEPEYHWINLKRNKKNHYHQDGGANIVYNEPDQDLGTSTAYYIPGKGYMMAISQTTFMNATGTLNRGSVPVTLTNQEPLDIQYASGWNLVGNPYQAYLDLSRLSGYSTFYVYDAEFGWFVPVSSNASDNPPLPSTVVHPHQGFFVHTDTDGAVLTFTQGMATATPLTSSYYREGKPNYPLVDIFAENSEGRRDVAVVEFHRPEVGGAKKLDAMHALPFDIAVHHGGESYGIFFATDDMERIPVRFAAGEDDVITLTWSTYNGVFTKLMLVDNITGEVRDMLTSDSYTFEARVSDYDSRFYIMYDCSGTGVGENEEDGPEPVEGAFAYVSGGNLVVETQGRAFLQVVDLFGRVVYGTVCAEGVQTVPTGRLAKGVYVVRLSTDRGTMTQKIVLQ